MILQNVQDLRINISCLLMCIQLNTNLVPDGKLVSPSDASMRPAEAIHSVSE